MTQRYIKYHCAVFNLIAWCLDCAGDILSFSLMRYNYLLSMSLAMGVSAGLSPIVYIIGAWDQVTRVSSSDQERKFSLSRLFRKKD